MFLKIELLDKIYSGKFSFHLCLLQPLFCPVGNCLKFFSIVSISSWLARKKINGYSHVFYFSSYILLKEVLHTVQTPAPYSKHILEIIL